MAEPIVSQYSRESFQSARDSYVPESAQSAAGIISSNTSIIESGKPRIIVAIDYGTTFSGLAWWQTDGEGEASAADLRLFQSYPEREAQKVPSKFSYSKTNPARRAKQWGYSIDEGSLVMQWTKLELDTLSTDAELRNFRELLKGQRLIRRYCKNMDTTLNGDAPLHLCRNSEDIVREYLEKLAEEWWAYMRIQARFAMERVPLDLVISHPADWSYEALNKTVRAVRAAFSPGRFKTLEDIYITSEPQAAASAIVQDIKDRDLPVSVLIAHEAFVVCDAGGGTVDIASYFIESDDPVRISPIGRPVGAKCGATFIQRKFIEWLQPKIQGVELLPKDYTSGGHFLVHPEARILLDRFERWMHNYDGSDQGVSIPLTQNITLVGVSDEELDSGTIELTAEDVREIFSDSVDGTVRLIAKQVTQLRLRRREGIPYKVKNIFLSGGFAENPYLYEEVKRWAYANQVDVQRASDTGDKRSWSGVVRGAVIQAMGKGIEGITKIQLCPRSYGIRLSQSFDYRHDDQAAVEDEFHGGHMVRDQAVWKVKKGDIVSPHEPLVRDETIHFRLSKRDRSSLENVHVVFVATGVAEPPANLQDLPSSKREEIRLEVPIGGIPVSAFTKRTRANGHTFDNNYWIVAMTVRIAVSEQVKINVLCKDIGLDKEIVLATGLTRL